MSHTCASTVISIPSSSPLLCLPIGFAHDTFPIRENAKVGLSSDGSPEGSGHMGNGQVLLSTSHLWSSVLRNSWLPRNKLYVIQSQLPVVSCSRLCLPGSCVLCPAPCNVSGSPTRARGIGGQFLLQPSLWTSDRMAEDKAEMELGSAHLNWLPGMLCPPLGIKELAGSSLLETLAGKEMPAWAG